MKLINIFILGVIFVLTSCDKSSPSTDRPNILFIFTDDQSHRTVSSYEAALPWANTPNIDQLAKEGIRFEHAFVGTWCQPARAKIMTGKLLHGIQGLQVEDYPISTHDPELFRMWPESFRKNGYYTAVIGKWHLGKVGHGRVWDHSIIWNRSEAGAGPYYVDQKMRFDDGELVSVGGYSTDNYTKYAKDFIRRDHQEPWVLMLNYDAVHPPHTPADRHIGMYDDARPVPIPEDVFPPRPTKPSYMQNYAMLEKGTDGVPFALRLGLPLTELVRNYHNSVFSLDEGIGQVMESLEETGQLDNTIVVFTSDQGIAMGHHGFTIKVGPYDDNIRVPMIIRLPDGTSKGQVVRTPVSGIDLIPTFFDYANIELPWKMHGHNLRPLLENPEYKWDHPVVIENFSFKYGSDTDVGITGPNPNQGVDWYIFLRDGRYKYIRTLRENEIEELYDLQYDPKELRNLALEDQYQEVLSQLRSRLTEELRATDAKLINNWPDPRIIKATVN